MAMAQLPWDSVSPQVPELRLYAEFEKPIASPGETVTLILRGFLEWGWHIYSVVPQGEEAPQPTAITYDTPTYEVIDGLEESKPQVIQDEALGLTLAVHQNEFVFRQKLKLSSEVPAGPQDLFGTLHYQICDNNICAPLQHQTFFTPLTVEP